jgi:3-deoxy-D-manno-octulosonate 8-phosphate phosphatase KdsC-like HAD superfamily phosphatase
MFSLPTIDADLAAKFRAVKLLSLDLDGTLTDEIGRAHV